MADKPSSPYIGLDKALLRSTQVSPAPQPSTTDQEPQISTEAPPTAPKRKASPVSRSKPSYRPSARDSTHASKLDSTEASMIASYHASDHKGVIEAIRKTVKIPGKEVSFVRLTTEEKGELADIVYTYKRQGKKTSENEINRIAVNYILQDYRANGNNSILAKVIDALLA